MPWAVGKLVKIEGCGNLEQIDGEEKGQGQGHRDRVEWQGECRQRAERTGQGVGVCAIVGRGLFWTFMTKNILVAWP